MIADAPRVRPLRLRNDAGQRLVARDLQDEYDGQNWRRAVHVAALHDTWGIALGFEATLGEGEAIIGPGLAYDCFGREIILSHDQNVPGPTAPPDDATPADRLVLAARYNSDLDAHRALADAFPCTDTGDRPGREEPLFIWRARGGIRLGLEVPILAARMTAKGLTDLDLSVRRRTRALVRPHIAAGSTEATQPWETWEDPTRETRFGIQTFVDTADAGFVGRPYYLATLRAAPATFAGIGKQLLFTSIVNPGPGGFTFRVAQARRTDTDFGPRAIKAATLRVVWIGVEPASGCAPLANPQLILNLLLLRKSFVGDFFAHVDFIGGPITPPPG
jgi:hypothetical protein